MTILGSVVLALLFAAEGSARADGAAAREGEATPAPRLAHGGYSAPELRLTTLNGDPAVLAGAQGGWILGHTAVLGVAGYGSISTVAAPPPLRPVTGDDAYLSIGYGGLRAGAIAYSMRRVHLTGGLLIGGGGATSATRDGSYRQSAGFFVLEPDVAFEVNLERHVRAALGGTFRYVLGDDRPGFTSARLSGPSVAFTLRFGEF